MNEIEQLTRMAANGDRSAFETLYQRTCQSVYFTCLSFLKNEQDASDVTQEVYLTALEQLPKLNDMSKFVPWLNKIAVNKCKNMLIKKKPVLMDYEDMENLQTEENENFLPEEYATNRAKRKIVMDIMEKSLSDILYQTVIMYYFNGMSVTEIAEITNCPVGTVTYRLSVARAKIKEGVLRYENRNDDKLYAFVGIPLLTSVLTAEMQELSVPDIFPNIIGAAVKGTVASQAAKGGANIMLRTLKSKIIAGVVAAAVVGGGIAAAVIISNKNEEKSGSTITAERDSESSTGQTTAQNTLSDTEATEESTEEAAETVNTDARWLLQQDFSTGRLETAPADFTLFNVKLATPVSIDDIKQSFDAEVYPPDGQEKVEGTAGEVLGCDALLSPTTKYSSCTVHLYDKGTGYNDMIANVDLYNYSEQDISIAECVNNNWWLISDDGYDRHELLGISESDISSDDDRGIMEELIKKLGSPNYLHVGDTKEEFIAGAVDNTQAVYVVGWIFDDFVLEVLCYDQFFYDDNTLLIQGIAYAPRELWNKRDFGMYWFEKENQIDEYFK